MNTYEISILNVTIKANVNNKIDTVFDGKKVNGTIFMGTESNSFKTEINLNIDEKKVVDFEYYDGDEFNEIDEPFDEVAKKLNNSLALFLLDVDSTWFDDLKK